MTTTTITRRTELAHRAGDGFELEVDGRHALDAFNHPYAYSARRKPGGSWQETAIDPERTDHARTDR